MTTRREGQGLLHPAGTHWGSQHRVTEQQGLWDEWGFP